MNGIAGYVKHIWEMSRFWRYFFLNTTHAILFQLT